MKDLTQKLSNLHAPNDKLNNNNNIVGEMKGIISKAKEGKELKGKNLAVERVAFYLLTLKCKELLYGLA